MSTYAERWILQTRKNAAQGMSTPQAMRSALSTTPKTAAPGALNYSKPTPVKRTDNPQISPFALATNPALAAVIGAMPRPSAFVQLPPGFDMNAPFNTEILRTSGVKMNYPPSVYQPPVKPDAGGIKWPDFNMKWPDFNFNIPDMSGLFGPKMNYAPEPSIGEKVGGWLDKEITKVLIIAGVVVFGLYMFNRKG